jgi:glycine/D-amino acid oxidase-like deaminating enzyme
MDEELTMTHVAGAGRTETTVAYPDLPVRSPWIAQLAPLGDPRPLDRDAVTDVAIVGAGIAGIATAFFTLRSTDLRVLVVEGDRVAHGASGRNAGQLTTYFERPLCDIARQFGDDLAIEGQRGLDDAHDLLDLMAAETGASVRIERFTGHMGMFALNHVLVHLRNNQLRERGGLRLEPCTVSAEADFVDDIPPELGALYTVAPQARIRELLETDDDRYRAVLSERKGCANSGALCQQVLAYLERRYPDRFRFVDRTPVERVVVGPAVAELHAHGHRVQAARVVLCTNGYTRHVVEDEAAMPILLHPEQRVFGTYGFMAAFAEDRPRTPTAMSYIRNQAVGSGEAAYVYITRRTYDRPDGPVTLTCMGGPEWPHEGDYDPWAPFPGAYLAELDAVARPYAQRGRAAGQPYDFHWHGLMGYMDGMVRVIGAHPGRPALLYNLGCNGVGFLPSIHGGRQVSLLLAGEQLPPSIFDPRCSVPPGN